MKGGLHDLTLESSAFRPNGDIPRKPPELYCGTAFDLVLNLYGIRMNDGAVVDLRESLRENVGRVQ
jgi:hypothetical protein